MSGDEEHTVEEHHDTTYVVVASIIFALVSYTFLFPCNQLIPLDRRTVAVVGGLACYLSRAFLFPSQQMDVIQAIDFEVLILLASIMIINHIVIHLKETKRIIAYFQRMIQDNPFRGYWMISFAAFCVSPFLTNDGVCLLFVEPILHAFEESMQENPTQSGTVRKSKLHSADALYFLLGLACSTNIGSALTYTGNPQNMIVASDAIDAMPSYKFTAYMLLPSISVWYITMKWVESCWMHSRAKIQRLEEDIEAFAISNDSTNPVAEVHTSGKLILEQMPLEPQLPAAASPSSQNGTNSKKSLEDSFGSPLSPRRRLAREREKTVKKPVFYVSSPVPYLIIIMLMLMIIMIFVDVMPIAALICLFSILMVLVVVLGNHWKNAVTWEPENEYDFYFQPHYHSMINHSKAAQQPTSESNIAMVTATAPPAYNYPCEKCNMSIQSEHSQHSRSRHSRHNSRSQHANSRSHSRHSSSQSQGFSISNQGEEVDQQTREEVNYVLPAASNTESVDQQPQSNQASSGLMLPHLGPLTKEDKIDKLNEFFDSLFMSIDYSLLLIFLGTFIVVENMASTGIPRYIWGQIVGKQPFKTLSSVVGISAFVLIASQLLGNVAVIQLAKPNVHYLDDESKRFAWAIISFVATVGGNLTITGSAANIIVAEKANRLDATISMDFFRHYRVCFWITLFSCIFGGCMLSFIVGLDNSFGSNW